MFQKRQFQRYIVRLPVTVRAGGHAIDCTTVRVSRKGFFVRSQRPLISGVPVELEVTLADASPCKLRGVVKHTRKSDLMPRMNGMGIEFTQTDPRFEAFVAGIERERG